MPDQPELDARGLPAGYCFDDDLEITPRQLKADRDAGEPLRLIDARLPREWDITRIDGAELLPLQQLPAEFADKLDGRQGERVVVYCHHGGRSAQFVRMLRQAGFTNARSMAGGIAVWNQDVEPGGPQY